MSLSKSLLKKASDIRSQSPELVAIELLKKAGMSDEQARQEYAQHELEKSAASTLVQSGIDYDKALELVKVAGVKVDQVASVDKSFEEQIAEFLEKSASEVSTVETRNVQLEKELAEALEKVASLQATLDEVSEANVVVPEPITKMASSGNFTNEDLAQLMSLPSELLEKVASTSEAPRRIGVGGGRANDGSSSDTFLSMLLG